MQYIFFSSDNHLTHTFQINQDVLENCDHLENETLKTLLFIYRASLNISTLILLFQWFQLIVKQYMVLAMIHSYPQVMLCKHIPLPNVTQL